MSFFSNAIRAGGATGVGNTHHHDQGKGKGDSDKGGLGKCTRLKQCDDVPLTQKTSSMRASPMRVANNGSASSEGRGRGRGRGAYTPGGGDTETPVSEHPDRLLMSARDMLANHRREQSK